MSAQRSSHAFRHALTPDTQRRLVFSHSLGKATDQDKRF
jgi:hypothetical protein